ncbi:MAG: protein-export chaperone SecB [Gammaproteobacteria bacterium]
MSAEENNEAKTNGNGNNTGRAFLLQQLYIKDMSFEAPNTPQIFQESSVEPDTELNIRTSHKTIGEHQFEVILHVRVHAKRGEETIFLIELDQAGTFAIQGYTSEDTATLLGTQCPTTLFPYAREAISSLIGKGGFPPLILQPINFDALFAQAQQQASQQTQQ